jgi:hypothetical protein
VKSLSRRALSWLLSSKALDSHMDFELHPTITLRPRSFNVLVATREMFIQALNKNLNLQRFKVLYVAGNYSGILSKLDRRFTELEIRRSFTVFQLMTTLEEAHHSLIIVEHDPMLYDDAAEMVEYISHALGDASKGAMVLLYSHAVDPFLEDLMKNADRVFYFEQGPRIVSKVLLKTQRDQTTLEAFS